MDRSALIGVALLGTTVAAIGEHELLGMLMVRRPAERLRLIERLQLATACRVS